jgi:hypothetical protein
MPKIAKPGVQGINTRDTRIRTVFLEKVNINLKSSSGIRIGKYAGGVYLLRFENPALRNLQIAKQ